jgi:hypothetical protein
MDDRERDKFYSASDATADNDEYELEPPDETVISPEERHAQEVARRNRESIHIDDVYRDANRDIGTEIVETWLQGIRLRDFRFQIKHLLIATAVLAIVMTLAKLGALWATLSILVFLSIVGLYGYIKWQESKQQAEADQRREEMYARRREFAAKGTIQTIEIPKEPVQAAPATIPLPRNETDEMWQEATKRESFRFQFSMQDMLIAMTVAAVVLGLIRILGGATPTATLLGLVALGGLVSHVIGFEPPKRIILGWWFILVLYLLLCIFAAV